MATCEYSKCRKPFQRMYFNQRYCKRPECVAARMKEKYAAKRVEYTDPVKHQQAERKRPCIKGCHNKTSNHFGICDECREKIMNTINTDYLTLAK